MSAALRALEWGHPSLLGCSICAAVWACAAFSSRFGNLQLELLQ
jgi:hypothetical protein